MLLGDVARGAADAEHFAVVVVREPRVDADPAVLAGGGEDVRHVVLDFAALAQRCEKAAVRDVRGARFEIEEAAADQVLGREPEDVVRGGVEVGEAALGVGGPDQVVRGFDEIAVAVLAFEQQLDDAALFGERALDGRELLGGFVGARAEARSHEAVDQLLGIAAVTAGGAQRDEHALLVPAAQLLDRNTQKLGGFLDAVFHI